MSLADYELRCHAHARGGGRFATVAAVVGFAPEPTRRGGAAPVRLGTAFQCCAHVVTFTAPAISLGRILLHRRTGIAVAERPQRRFATAPAAS